MFAVYGSFSIECQLVLSIDVVIVCRCKLEGTDSKGVWLHEVNLAYHHVFSLSLSLHLVMSSRPQRKLTTKDPLVFHRGFRFLKFTRVLNIPSSAGRFDWRFDLMYEPLPPTPPSPPFPPLPPPPVVAGMKKHSVYLAEGLRRGGGREGKTCEKTGRMI